MTRVTTMAFDSNAANTIAGMLHPQKLEREG